MKGAVAFWIEQQLILAQLVRPGPSGDYRDLIPLATTAYPVQQMTRLIADGGYDSEANHHYCRQELNLDSLIPAHNKRGTIAKAPLRRQMQKRLGVSGTELRGKAQDRQRYRQRWLVETLISVIKRKWGDSLTARLPHMQERQSLMRGVVYNLYRIAKLKAYK